MPPAIVVPLRTALTVKEVVQLYLQNHARLKKSSWKDDARYLKKDLLPKLGARLAVTITSEHLKNLRSAGLLGVRMHDLRRTVGSWLVQNGESLHLVGNVLNHKDPKTTAGYAYFQTQHRQAALDRHGEKVMGISERPAKGFEEAVAPTASTTKIDALKTQGMCRFSRVELYGLEWSEPVSKLAAKYGISDVGLSKACRRANIPLPQRGYWAKLAAGQSVQKCLLEPATPNAPDEIAIRARTRESSNSGPKGADDLDRSSLRLTTEGDAVITGVADSLEFLQS
jgi:hypothetical protein